MKIKPKPLEQREQRAWAANGKPCTYKLGRGGFNAQHPNSATWDGARSDCSGFGSWVFMTRRAPKEGRPFWFETTAIYNDAEGEQSVFVRIPEPVPGCMVVYGDSNGKQGHMGIVVAVGPDGEYDAIDCATGRGNRAIKLRTDAQKLFGKRGAIFCVLRQDLE